MERTPSFIFRNLFVYFKMIHFLTILKSHLLISFGILLFMNIIMSFVNTIPRFLLLIGLLLRQSYKNALFQYLWPLWSSRSSGHFITLFKYLSLSVNSQSQTVMWDYFKLPKPQTEWFRRTAAGLVWEKLPDPWLITIIFFSKKKIFPQAGSKKLALSSTRR